MHPDTWRYARNPARRGGECITESIRFPFYPSGARIPALSLGYESEGALSIAFQRVVGCSRGRNPAPPSPSEAEAAAVIGSNVSLVVKRTLIGKGAKPSAPGTDAELSLQTV